MKPAARIQATIELVTAIEAEAQANGASIDEAVRHFFRKRRYAGSKDRRAVTGLAYDVVRQHAQDMWRLDENDTMACRVALRLAMDGENWQPFFASKDPYSPEALSDDELASIEAAITKSMDAAPSHARYGFPAFLNDAIEARFGDRLDAEMMALQDRADLDLRVNILKGTLENARNRVEREELTCQTTSLSPFGLRLPAGSRIQDTHVYQKGRVEVQDEGSQVAALLCGAKAGDQIIDLCAGAGGKTLALAAMMENKGQIHAFDNDAKRLKAMPARLARGGVHNVQVTLLDEAGHKRLGKLANSADVVLVDSPCSGSGTWRRDPALPWRLTPDRLTRLTDTQQALLQAASELTSAKGRIVYVTCSILPQENEEVVERFLSQNSGWKLRPYRDIWPSEGDRPVPNSLSMLPEALQLSPASHATDGFFIAVLERHD